MSARSVYEKRKQTKRNRLHGWQFFKKEIKEKTNSGCKTLSTTKKKKKRKNKEKGNTKLLFFFLLLLGKELVLFLLRRFVRRLQQGLNCLRSRDEFSSFDVANTVWNVLRCHGSCNDDKYVIGAFLLETLHEAA